MTPRAERARRARLTIAGAVGAALVVSAAAVLLLRTPGPSPQDAAFVGEMIPHHHLGMELVGEASVRATDVNLRRLVFEMGNYHGPELRRLERRATRWSVDPAEEFPGSIGERPLRELARLGGTAYDASWLELMIHHHRGAVTLSSREVRSGDDRSLVALARSVLRVQRSQLAEMRALLRRLRPTG